MHSARSYAPFPSEKGAGVGSFPRLPVPCHCCASVRYSHAFMFGTPVQYCGKAASLVSWAHH